MAHAPHEQVRDAKLKQVDLPSEDRAMLRGLASEVAEIASESVHREKIRLWTKLNDLESERPMVWVNEVCWNEMNVDDELTLRCSHDWAKSEETRLRRLIYQWRHFPGDMVVNDYIECPLEIHSTQWGICEDVDTVSTDVSSDVVSRHFNLQIQNEDDLEKIKLPVVTYDEAKSDFHYAAMCDLYDSIIPVRKTGRSHIWFTPWDNLIRWYGIAEAMMDMIDRPDFVHAAVERMVASSMSELDQLIDLKVLKLDNDSTRVGSGGYGYTSALPGDDFDPDWVKPSNMWGCSNAQIFSEVSPQMHWDFAIEHELRWMERWGMNYYGCCEPLDGKMDLMRRIPNLRKISVSPWCNLERAVDEIAGDYVASRKPSPAILAPDHWNPGQARADIREFLDLAKGKSHVELIMKDISTVHYEPQRLWEWTAIAMEEASA